MKMILSIFFEFNKIYVDSPELNEIHAWFYSQSKIIVGCFMDSKLIGVAYGKPWIEEKVFLLELIAVRDLFKRKGYGSMLLRYFENQVKKHGYSRITLGSAFDINVENFYLKNQYKAISIFTHINGQKEYFKVNGYNLDKRKVLKQKFKEINYVMERDLM